MLRVSENSVKHRDICAITQESIKLTWEKSSLEETLSIMEGTPILPSVDNMKLLMQRCTKEENLTFARRISALIHKHRLVNNISLGNHLVQMLVSCKGLSDAHDVFEKLPFKEHYAWNSLIQGFSDSGNPLRTLELFERMQEKCVRSAMHLYPAVFKACARLKRLDKGRQIHSESVARGFELDLYVGNSVVGMYSKCGSLSEAQELLKKQRVKDAISWNVLISVHADLGQGDEALACLERMQMEGLQPDAGTFVCSLKACSVSGSISKGQKIHIQVVKEGWDRVFLIANSLVDMYAKCGWFEEAQKALNSLASPNLESWTALISGYAENGLALEALNSYKRMQKEGLYPDGITFVCCLKACRSIGALSRGQEVHLEVVKAGLEKDYLVSCILVDMYAKGGLVQDAQRAFDALSVCDVISWTALIAGYSELGHTDMSLKLLQRMQVEGITPNATTYTCILKSCGNLGAIESGRHIHAGFAGDQHFMLESMVSFSYRENKDMNCRLQASLEKLTGAVIDMYSRCGYIFDAKRVFDMTTTTNLVTCNTLIMGYSRQGESRLVACTLERMKEEKIVPDGVTFIGLLTACSHAGLLEIACKYYEDLVKVFVIDLKIEHCNCMMDLCSRAGQRDVAIGILEHMPFQPDLFSFGSMFSMCRNGDFVELGRKVLHGAFHLGRDLAPVLISISNMYATAHMWEDVDLIREILEAWKDS